MPAEPVLCKRARPRDAEVRVADRIEGLIGKVRAAIDKVLDRLVGLVSGFIGSISAAAARVEAMLAGVLTLAISFLAGFAGLDKLVDKITGSIEKVRSAVDKAIDWLVGILTSMANNKFRRSSITRMRKRILDEQSTKVAIVHDERPTATATATEFTGWRRCGGSSRRSDLVLKSEISVGFERNFLGV